ncbi:hypothetical protein C7H19_09205 [Aphanothece hegewaldii CCALA 016]|uniref:Uncharacterized protein n=1 Tax=Aphanothece hegewaldii CCALA 016 TaxID=2107694 RepID=A0A2T1LZE6_9CHRO|nr:hypothetical protein [Aphanothece hegewaldii]PSF37716.1 hypothetical protein C7H19_09205 [Aphanothece hegewaldii CCALA 016]
MMEELKTQIKYESNRAARLSKEAIEAFEDNNKIQGKALMNEARAASKNCQNLIKQFNDVSVSIEQS